MHRLLLASTVLVGLAAALPASATITVPAGAQAAPATATNNPLVTRVWWDRHHHWHRRHYNSWHNWRRHTAPLPIVPGAPR